MTLYIREMLNVYLIKDLEQAEIGARNALIELLKETHVTYIDLL
jgi:hypothetical protein